ncbi:biotin-dependent carboxyltransferase family protein [Desertivirga brevis]|uniref:5-oxoprolinase subunit C family protein n=1 Tax=Desertivirga brevis TaxID=2810310 RepID=UPI001A97371D|nr:biotin-dependent carboxyltransferase family protein [Pedobacter sp. SYSU D00873]
MQLKILKPGLLSTIQDLGRLQHLAEAVPVSGAMDQLSCRIANIVLGNDENAPVIEFTYHGAELYAETDLLISFSGEGAVLHAEGINLPSDRPIFLPATTRFSLAPGQGCRSYLAVIGGWNVPTVLGSASTYLTAEFGGLHGRNLKENDLIVSSELFTPINRNILNRYIADKINYLNWSASKNSFLPTWRKAVRVIPGKEFTWFSAESLLGFLSEPFTVNVRSDRMAYQLEGSPITRNKPEELISTAVAPGTIQVTGDGKLMLLMADCQTTGGYPRIAQVASVDLAICAQLKPGDEVFFEDISRKEAEKLYLKQEQNFKELKASIANKFA